MLLLAVVVVVVVVIVVAFVSSLWSGAPHVLLFRLRAKRDTHAPHFPFFQASLLTSLSPGPRESLQRFVLSLCIEQFAKPNSAHLSLSVETRNQGHGFHVCLSVCCCCGSSCFLCRCNCCCRCCCCSCSLIWTKSPRLTRERDACEKSE